MSRTGTRKGDITLLENCDILVTYRDIEKLRNSDTDTAIRDYKRCSGVENEP